MEDERTSDDSLRKLDAQRAVAVFGKSEGRSA